MNLKGKILVVSGPSGSGKTTVCKELQKKIDNSRFSVSVTTRPIRSGEKEGKDYYFVSKQIFFRMEENGELIEWEEVHGNLYGTPKSEIKDLKNNETILFDVDPKGALSIKNAFPESILIFILPPSEEELYNRLKNRKTEDDQIIKKRLDRVPLEMALADKFDINIKNINIEDTINEILELLKK